MDLRGGALARRFRRHRRALGLDLATPYFNAGLMVVDRAAWRAAELGERAARALRDEPRTFPFMEQDALNATLAGGFAPLSPRCNFMGDFFLLDLEAAIAPIVLHFVNRPKPWEYARLARRGALRRSLPKLVRRFALAGLVGARPGRARAQAAPDRRAPPIRRTSDRLPGRAALRR